MKKHVKIYYKHFGYALTDVIQCEICTDVAVDIHHIEARGMGGKNSEADKIENLMALCRKHHDEYGDVKDMKPYLQDIHNAVMEAREIELLSKKKWEIK